MNPSPTSTTPWHPAVLQLVAQTVACANRLRKDVSVCGEMAGDPAFTELLLGMGLRSFSMHPSQIVVGEGANPGHRREPLGIGDRACDLLPTTPNASARPSPPKA